MSESDGNQSSYYATLEEIGAQMPRNLVSQELPRERKRWIRPPLIGQTTATEHFIQGQPSGTNKTTITQSVTDDAYKSLPEYSGNWSDMPAFAFHHHLQPETGLTSPSSQSLSFPLDTRMNTNNSSASTHIIGHRRHGVLTVIENAHSESKAKKENKSEPVIITSLLDNGGTNEEVPATVPESPNARAPSPASVSSVTSSRRLEWDSGADVGYLAYQISNEISISGHDMSTIERIALAQGCSTALSMRLDPEGTVYSGQQSSNMLLLSNHMKTHKHDHQTENSKTPVAKDPTKSKCVSDSVPSSAQSENNVTPSSSTCNISDHEDSSMEEGNNESQRVTSNKNEELLSSSKDHENGMQVKKLSSSLTGLNELEPQDLKDSNTLYRSQSQNSVSVECVSQKYDHNPYPSLSQKNSNAVRNSLSSSSLATVVCKHDYRKTSNKHTQTSPYASVKQSVVAQVYGDKHAIEPHSLDKNKNFPNKYSYFEHTGFTDHSDMILEKTSDAELSTNASRVVRNKHDSAKAAVSEQLKTAFQKQTLHSAVQETINSSESQDSYEAEISVKHREVSNGKTSQRNGISSKHVQPTDEVQNPSHNLDNLQANSSWFLNDVTLKEKSQFNDTSQGGSMDAIDSVQSFEYLPGHAFENITKRTLDKDINKLSSSPVLQQDINLNVTSSESSASNTFSKDLDRIVTQMTNYLNDRPHSSSEKKRLVQKIVKQLLETKYTDDSSSRESHKTQATSYDMVIGEKSSETVTIKRCDLTCKMPQKVFQHTDNKEEHNDHQTPVHLSDKCIGTALSEESVPLSSTSQSPALEAAVSSHTASATYTTDPISTTASTSCKSNTSSWKKHSVQIGKEYELCKQNHKQNHSQSVLLNICKSERENQLSWICTEIRHLKRLKQLLDDQERLLDTMEKKTQIQGGTDKYVKPYSSPTDTMSTKTSGEKSKRFLETSSTTSTEQEIHSTEKRNAILNNIYRSREMSKVLTFNTAKAPSKYNREEKYLHVKSNGIENGSKIQQMSISKEHLLEKPSICSRKHIEKLREEIKTNISKSIGVQTSPRSSSSSSFKTYVMSGKSEDHSSSGRINVYIQTKDKTSSSDELKDYKTNESSETHKCNSEVPLCCCECKKLCEEFKRKLLEVNKPDTVKQNKSRSSQVVSHESADDKLSSYGTLNDAAELTKDSDCHAQINSLKETRGLKKSENASVQTTFSFKEAFIGRSEFSSPYKNKQTMSKNDNTQENCLCHKLVKNGFARDLESQAQIQQGQKSAVQQESLKNEEKPSFDSDWKNSHHKPKELKTKGGHTSKKCITCNASISESSRSKHTRRNQLCNDCYQKASSLSSTSISSSPELPNKEPVAYILTLESASEISILEQTERKQLKEIVMKVPMKKRSQTYASRNKKQVKQKKTRSMSKESHMPKFKIPSDNFGNSETAGVKSLTLQEYLMTNRPDFIQNAEQRRSCLKDLAQMREHHQKYKRERLTVAAHVNSTTMMDLPRPPLAIKRVFSQHTLRAQTEQKYRKLPEMQVKNVERKKKEEFRTNRLMAQIFAKKLQKKALRGEVSLSNSRSVISTL